MSAYQYINKWASGSFHKVSADVAYAVTSDLARQNALNAALHTIFLKGN